jgi:hypothetical protein
MAPKSTVLLPARRDSPGTKPAPLPSPLREGAAAKAPHVDEHPPLQSEDAEPPAPRRTGSFGRGLGLHALSSMTLGRAGDSVSLPAFAKRSADGSKTPPAQGGTPRTTSDSSAKARDGLMGPPATPDPSHLAHFSLRLSELVNRAFQPCIATSTGSNGASSTLTNGSVAARIVPSAAALPAVPQAPALHAVTYQGHALPSAARATELAETVTTELRYAAHLDDYLLRAVSRAAVKALSLFAERMDALLIAPQRDGAAAFVPLAAKDGASPPAALEYNLGLVAILWTVEDALEKCVEGDDAGSEPMPHFVAEILASVRQRMDRSILHIVQPILVAIKLGLVLSLGGAVPVPFEASDALLLCADGLATPASAATKTNAAVPAWFREFEGRAEGARRLLLPRLESRCGIDGEGWYVGIAVHTIWKGLLRLTAKPMPLPLALVDASAAAHVDVDCDVRQKARSPTPAQLSNALKAVAGVTRPRRKGEESRPASRQGNHDGSSSTPRSPSLPAVGTAGDSSSISAHLRASQCQAFELGLFEKQMVRFAEGFRPKGAPHAEAEETDDSDADELARAALEEALQAIRHTSVVAAHLDKNPQAVLLGLRLLREGKSREAAGSSALGSDVARALRAIPPLLLLHLVYARAPQSPIFQVVGTSPGDAEPPRARVPSPPALFGLTWPDYSRSLAGFASGDAWALACARGWSEGIELAWSEVHANLKNLNEELENEEASAESARAAPSDDTALRPSDPSPADELPARPKSTLSRRSSVSEHEALPDSMTQSLPTLDGSGQALAPAADDGEDGPSELQPSGSPVAKKRWALLRRSRLGQFQGASARAHDASAPLSTAPSPDKSPVLAPACDADSKPTSPGPAGAATPRRGAFWRASSAGPAPFRLALPLSRSSSARGSVPLSAPEALGAAPDATGPPASASQALLHSQIHAARCELAALNLLARAAEAVSASLGTPLDVHTPQADDIADADAGAAAPCASQPNIL